jgi:NtrC-family two-component system response regulator AlgB
MKILLIGDEPRLRRLLSFGIAAPSDETATICTLAGLARLPDLRAFEIALLDWEMRAEEAPAFLRQLGRLAPHLPVVALTARPARARDALAAGAREALLKPVDIDATRAALARHASADAAPAASPRTDADSDFFPTRSEPFKRLLGVAGKVAASGVNVLLLGENGTGKTMLARSLHAWSPRDGRPFVTVNCPCLQPQLLESELFGHVRGAFTGAVSDAPGLVEAAEGGTLFLDEVGELPPALQPKLLRLLEERRYERVGEPRTRHADIRIIAATNRDLRAEVAAGRFREDLFYRLNVIALEMPPLRRRPEDILPTADRLLADFARAQGRPTPALSADARLALQRHSWPGNLRELRNSIERAVVLCEGDLVHPEHLPELDAQGSAPALQIGDFVTLAAVEEAHIRRVIERTGSFMQAARLLGINKTTLYRRRRRGDDGTLPFDPDLHAAMTG